MKFDKKQMFHHLPLISNGALILMIVLYYLLKKKKCKIATLRYKLSENDNKIDFQLTNTDLTNPIGLNVALTDEKFDPISKTIVSFFSFRIEPSVECPEVKDAITESFNILDQDNDRLEATSTYFDSGSLFQTSVPEVTYVVTGANGKYAKAKTATIFFDNDKGTRVIKIYS